MWTVPVLGKIRKYPALPEVVDPVPTETAVRKPCRFQVVSLSKKVETPLRKEGCFSMKFKLTDLWVASVLRSLFWSGSGSEEALIGTFQVMRRRWGCAEPGKGYS